MANLQITDLIVVGREGTSYQTTFEDFKDSIFIDSPLGINEVLTKENTVDPGQSLHFRVTAGDIPPFTTEIIDVDAASGLLLGGLVSYYTINEPFTLDTFGGATEFARSKRRISAVDDYYFAIDSNDKSITAGIGVNGINYSGDDAHLELSPGTLNLRVGEYDAPLLKIEAQRSDGKSSITAGEFIGDGSKLTNLPVDLSEYAKLDDSSQSITANEFIGDGSKLTNLPGADLEGVYVKDEYIPSLPEAEGNELLDGNLEVHPLKSGDKIVLHRDGVDYNLTAQQLKRYVHEIDNEEDPPLGQWFHVKQIRGGRLRINSQSGSVQAIDVLGEASKAPWYIDQEFYHYGRSIRIWDCGEDSADPNLETFETWGDIGEVAGGYENVDNFFDELNFDRSNFLGADHTEDEGDREMGLWLLPTSKVREDRVEVPNNHQYIIYVRSDASWDKMFRPEPGCSYEIAHLTNTTNITNWAEFFKEETNYIPSLRYLDVSNGTDFNRMFYQAKVGNRTTISNWNVSKGVNFEYMFAQSDFDGDVSDWDVSNATNMKEMFMQAKLFSCGNKGTADNGIGQWRPKPEVNLDRFIYQCEKLEYDMSEWFTANNYPELDLNNLDNPDITVTGTWLNDYSIRNSNLNDKTWLRFPDGTVEQMIQSSQKNRPWEVGWTYPYYGYWSTWRFLKNPRYGADARLLKLWDDRKTLWTKWKNWCDTRLNNGTYDTWKQIKDQTAKDEFQKYLNDDAALVEEYEAEL